jgi:hypothetical protein
MKDALRTFSEVLQLRRDTVALLLGTRLGVAWALRMFVVVTLIAGLGLWLNLPAVLRVPTATELIDGVVAAARSAGAAGMAIARGVLGGEAVEVAPAIVNGVAGGNGGLVLEAGRRLLSGESLRGLGALPSDSEALVALVPVMAGLNMGQRQFTEALAGLGLTAPELAALLRSLSIEPETLGAWLAQTELRAGDLERFVATLRSEAVKASPLLGARPSRVIRLFGEWISTPLAVAATWLPFALVLMLAARALGGQGRLEQHIAAVALAAAPSFLLLLDTAPRLGYPISPSIGLAVHLFGRILALVAFGWAAAILLQGLSVAHGFSMWRALGAVLVALFVVLVLLPLAAVSAVSFVLAG